MKTRSFFNLLVPAFCRSFMNRNRKNAWITAAGTTFIFTLTSLLVNAQEDSMSQLQVAPPAETDSITTDTTPHDSGDTTTGVSTEAIEEAAAPYEEGAVATEVVAPVRDKTVPATARLRNIDLVNIVLKNRKVRVRGWGEYVVGGHCLCCDNMKSIDCVSVKTRNRTDKQRLKQLVDGKIPPDTSDRKTFFGNVYERDNENRPTEVLMTNITWKKRRDIYKVIVYTVADSLKTKNVKFNCQLAYYDQFDRLRWLKKVKDSGKDEKIVFDLEKPVLTKKILLKIRDGRNKLTEVAVFGKAEAQ